MESLWIRKNVTDRAMRPLREQISGLLPDDAGLVEIGCANGRLLLDNANRIRSGVGIDTSARMIASAREAAEEDGHTNLEFFAEGAETALEKLTDRPTHAIASLVLHEMPNETAVDVMRTAGSVADNFIVADFIAPKSRFVQAYLYFDEWMAGHVGRYIEYKKGGGMPARIEQAGLTIDAYYETEISVIGIWICKRA